MQENLTFEERFRRLQETITALEQGGLPLDQAIARFEQGMDLAAQCRVLLEEAELKITRLVESELLQEAHDEVED